MTPLEARQAVIEAIGPDWWYVDVRQSENASAWNSYGGKDFIDGSTFTITWQFKTGYRREAVETTLEAALARTLEIIAAENTIIEARRAITVGNLVTAMTNEALRNFAVA